MRVREEVCKLVLENLHSNCNVWKRCTSKVSEL